MKALVIIKSMGIGDLCILIPNIHAISKKISNPVTVLAQKNTRAQEILKNDPHVKEVVELNEKQIKGFFGIVKILKSKKFDQCYIYSDSIRLYLISKFSNINKIFHYKFFSKKGKNFFKAAKEFTEKNLNIKIDSKSKIYWNNEDIEKTKKKFNIQNNVKNIVCGISASVPTKRWDVANYIKLFEMISSKFQCNFFIAGGLNDQVMIDRLKNSSFGKNCLSFSNLNIEQIIPIISSCNYYIGNDTGFGHLSASLNCKCLMIFTDSPPKAYGLWNNNIEIIVPVGETIDSCSHNTRGKDKISFDEVLKKSLKLIN